MGSDGGGGSDGGDGSIAIEGGAGGDSGSDGPAPKPIHRLIVSNLGAVTTEGVLAWDDAHLLKGDRAPDVVLQSPALQQAINAMRLVGDRLFVYTNGQLMGIDNAQTMTASTTPSFSIAVNGMPDSIHYSSMNDLLFLSDRNQQGSNVTMFSGGSQLKNGDMAAARFGSPGEPVTAVYRDPANDRLYFADPLQQVIKYTPTASVQSGNAMPIIDLGSGPNVQSMASDGTRLYAGGRTLQGEAAVFVYNLAGIKPGAQPDAVVKSGFPAQGSIVFGVHVADNVLFAGYTGNGGAGTLVFANALSLGNQSTGVPLPSSTGCYSMRYSPKTDRLYCTEPTGTMQGVNVWDKVKTAPALAGHITSHILQPKDLELWEN